MTKMLKAAQFATIITGSYATMAYITHEKYKLGEKTGYNFYPMKPDTFQGVSFKDNKLTRYWINPKLYPNLITFKEYPSGKRYSEFYKNEVTN